MILLTMLMSCDTDATFMQYVITRLESSISAVWEYNWSYFVPTAVKFIQGTPGANIPLVT